MKKMAAVFLIAILFVLPAAATVAGAPETNAGAVLLMERETGTILYESNSHEQFEPASVTKIMTLLLIMEAIEDGRLEQETMINVSATAAGMGGSQVYLKEGEQMSVHDMLKAIVVASGNDASVAMAEAIAGSEEAFVTRMNERAADLGMADTMFLNCTGLPAEGHVTSAYDIALMSQALLGYDLVKEYTTIWTDSLRDGEFGLANTNKLVRFYEGTTGLKTGSTNNALYCMSASAERDGMELIAVVLKSPTSTERFETAKSLLNFGFANYAMVDVYPNQALAPIDVVLGEAAELQPVFEASVRILVEKTQVSALTQEIEVCTSVEAPVAAGQQLGQMVVSADGEVLKTIAIVAPEEVPRLTTGGIFSRLLQVLLMREA